VGKTNPLSANAMAHDDDNFTCEWKNVKEKSPLFYVWLFAAGVFFKRKKSSLSLSHLSLSLAPFSLSLSPHSKNNL
jgi:hypothetical protein